MNDQNQVANDQNQQAGSQFDDQQIQDQQAGQQPTAIGIDKEKELPKAVEEPLEEVKEYEVPKEVRKHVIPTKEAIEVPPDLKKMGASAPPASAKVSDVVTGAVKLPLTDDEIEQGLHVKIISSFRWLAEWCLKQLKKAHVHLVKQGEHYKQEKN